MSDALPPPLPRRSRSTAAASKLPSRWPVTLGILATVFGGCGILSYGFGTILSFLNRPDRSATDTTGLNDREASRVQETLQSIAESLDRWATLSVLFQSILLLLSVVLLAGGILLLRRQPGSVPLLKGWAWGKILCGIAASLIGFFFQHGVMTSAAATARSVLAAPDASPSSTWNVISATATVTTALVYFLLALWVCALPVFTLIWLRRKTVREDLAAWRSD